MFLPSLALTQVPPEMEFESIPACGQNAICVLTSLTVNSITGTGTTPTISGFNGTPEGMRNVTAYGAASSTVTATATTNGTSTVTLASFVGTNDYQNGALIAMAAQGPTATILAPASLTISSLAETANGYANSGATSYTYSVCAVDSGFGLGPKVTTTNAALNSYLSPANANRLAWPAVTGAKLYDVCGCTGGACSPTYIGFSRSIGYVDSGSLTSTLACPCTASPTADNYYGSIVSGGLTNSIVVTPAVSQTGTATLTHDNLTPIQNAMNSLAGVTPPGGLVWIPQGIYDFMGWFDIPNYVHLRGAGAGVEYGTAAGSSEATYQPATTLRNQGGLAQPSVYMFNGLHQGLTDLVIDDRLGSWMSGIVTDTTNTVGAGDDFGYVDRVGINGVHNGFRAGGTSLCGTSFPNCDVSVWNWNNVSLNDTGCNGSLLTCADTTAVGFLLSSLPAGPQSGIHGMSVTGTGKWLYKIDGEYGGTNPFTVENLTDGSEASGDEMIHWAAGSGGSLIVKTSADEPIVAGSYTVHVPANSLIGTGTMSLEGMGLNNKVSFDSPAMVFSRNNICPNGNVTQVNYSSTGAIAGVAQVFDEGMSSGGSPNCKWTYGANSGLILGQPHDVFATVDSHLAGWQVPELDIAPSDAGGALGTILKQFVGPATAKLTFCLINNGNNIETLGPSTANNGGTCAAGQLTLNLATGIATLDAQFSRALVALGGGAAPTVGTIGGSGPATAAQNSWLQVKDSAGNNMFIPVWK